VLLLLYLLNLLLPLFHLLNVEFLLLFLEVLFDLLNPLLILPDFILMLFIYNLRNFGFWHFRDFFASVLKNLVKLSLQLLLNFSNLAKYIGLHLVVSLQAVILHFKLVSLLNHLVLFVLQLFQHLLKNFFSSLSALFFMLSGEFVEVLCLGCLFLLVVFFHSAFFFNATSEEGIGSQSLYLKYRSVIEVI